MLIIHKLMISACFAELRYDGRLVRVAMFKFRQDHDIQTPSYISVVVHHVKKGAHLLV